MDPPDIFSGLYDDDAYEEATEKAPRMPQEQRSRPPRPGMPPLPQRKDQTVNLDVDPIMYAALALAQRRGDVITSGSEGYPGDGVHSDTSLHYKGIALDVRLARALARQIADYTRAGYHVLRELTHLHVSKRPPGFGGAGASGGW